MGGKSSRDDSWRQASRSTSSSWNYEYPQTAYPPQPQESYNYPVQHAYPSYAPPPPQEQQYPPPSQDFASRNHAPPQRRLDRRYSRIADNYNSLEEVTEALARAGLESSNLIVGIDFTKSNEWTGKKSFNGRSLHNIGHGLNPYEQAISIIGKTLAAFDDDNLIPCFGFGDASTHDQDVFSFYPDERFCNGFEEVLSQYREIAPRLKLAGPTSFAPVIEMAMTIVEQSGGQYHVLLIIADGQVTRSVDTGRGQLSPQEQKTVDAIVEASKFPLSIILVGVGDGPWDMMKEFDDNIPAREFDNFQFVNFTEIMSKSVPQSRKETEFALSALMEIPSQYKATMELGLLGGHKGKSPGRVALPPPLYGPASLSGSKASRGTSFQHTPSSYYDYKDPASTASSFPHTSSSYYDYKDPASTASSFPHTSSSYYDPRGEPTPSAPVSTYDNQLCPICLSNPKDMAFGCGHQTCCDCGKELDLCPICRSSIQTRIKLY
ncbi:PREDICTED: E3 ubiquitin-protein ligase RGLG2-like isoform X1 [Ipomoea nil]|uniref:E3 ubiquitin-protein ligase RGLG2-like isoform X1 n=1 Tax=Ipomoea nil TaxID=35883 RepID=UPI000900BAE4|nr:PREDICTED: E3 ubiquitin-protein ligase RGLG2-like isoform X1 [Ipomoea nil]XP_019185591.1 PREDICTED: E3 ubiquitin-protein ligase RGLG2-like isoform X1 [Ipomoea nil]XP_019185592.1 PREDICTED: E3 ubiquitin-protein ligase RGLG2-like isoform X1 [Ipomoea nil]XP_019185593.1 PREDICTED: E3 ubiquitin-protein ligase RGLG2-like isoform X1 [Ipomoea nil]